MPNILLPKYGSKNFWTLGKNLGKAIGASEIAYCHRGKNLLWNISLPMVLNKIKPFGVPFFRQKIPLATTLYFVKVNTFVDSDAVAEIINVYFSNIAYETVHKWHIKGGHVGVIKSQKYYKDQRCLHRWYIFFKLSNRETRLYYPKSTNNEYQDDYG